MALSNAVDQSAVARVLGIETNFVNLRGSAAILPQRIAVIGQGATSATYATTKQQVTSAAQVGSLYGFGSPVHLAAKQLFPVNGDGVGTIPVTIYPLEDDVSGVTASGSIAVLGVATDAGEYVIRVNNIDSESIVIASGDDAATISALIDSAINAVIGIPVESVDSGGSVDIDAKWDGASGNDIYIEVVGSGATGVTFTVTQLSGGLVNPDVQDALDQVGNVWETMVVNCLEMADTTALDAYSTFGEGRWGALVRKPIAGVFTGTTESTVSGATTIPDARPLDRTNVQIPVPGGHDLPLQIAARACARAAVKANNNPPFDYGSQKLTGLTPGADGEQWDYAERDQAVKAGSSTTESKDGVVNMSDTITFYKPTGEEPPAFRFVVDNVKNQNVLFNLDLAFATEEWDGAPVIEDSQPTTNPEAKKPKMVVAELASVIDDLGLAAIFADAEAAKSTIQAAISGTNPKRIDWTFTAELAGNANIISGTYNFGFNFGEQAVVA
jgi:phage tail sheath gpL-like